MSRGIGSDGIKRGTNYIHRAKLAAMADMVPRQIAAAAAQRERCAAGQHAETTAERNRVTHLPGAGRVEPGTRYCMYCYTVLGHPWWVADFDEDSVPGGQLVDAPNRRVALARFRAAMVEHFMGCDSRTYATERVRVKRPVIIAGPLTAQEAYDHALGWAWAWEICNRDKVHRIVPGGPAPRELAERELGAEMAARIEAELARDFGIQLGTES